MAYCFDVPMRYVAAMEVPDPFDHAYKLHAKKVGNELMLGVEGYPNLLGVTD